MACILLAEVNWVRFLMAFPSPPPFLPSRKHLCQVVLEDADSLPAALLKNNLNNISK